MSQAEDQGILLLNPRQSLAELDLPFERSFSHGMDIETVLGYGRNVGKISTQEVPARSAISQVKA